MGKTWGRLYAGTRHHRKIRILRQRCPESWWIFYPLLELAFETDDNGLIYVVPEEPFTLPELATEVGLASSELLESTLQTMTSLKLISFENGFIRFLSFSERQFESDDSKERVRKHRERLKKEDSNGTIHFRSNGSETIPDRDGNGNETLHDRYGNENVTPPEQNRTEQIKVPPSGGVAASAPPDGDASAPRADFEQESGSEPGDLTAPPTAAAEPEPPVSNQDKKTQPEEKIGNSSAPKFGPSDLASLWNELGCRPQVQKLTDIRRKKAAVRLRQRDAPEWWRGLLEKVRDLQAKGRHWLTFDFIISSENNILKVVEGNYDKDFQTGKKPAIAAGNQPTGAKLGKYSSLVAGNRAGPEVQPGDGAPA